MNKKHVFTFGKRIQFKNDYFQILIRDDNKLGFLKIIKVDNKEKFVYPSACEFLNLSYSLNLN